MEQMERYKHLIKFDTAAAILFVEIGLCCLLQARYYSRVITMPLWRRGNWFMTGLYGTMLFVFHNLYDGLKISFFRKNNTVCSQFLVIFTTGIFGYLLLALTERHWYVPPPFVISTAVDMTLVFFWASIFQWTYNPFFPPRQLLLIYGKRLVAHALEKMDSRGDKHALTAAVRIDEDMEYITQKVLKYSGVIIGNLGSHDRNLIFKRCYEMDKCVYMIPRISDVLIRNSDELKLFDIVLLLSRNNGLQVDQLSCRHMLDILSAGVLPTLSLPFFSLFVITIRLEDRSPVFHKQCRLTKDGKTFDILKFRTMRVNAEADDVACLAAQIDDRITWIGKVLRATRLDELPQVLNILKGDMSTVGPRPKRLEIAVEYKGEIPELDYRLEIKADLTGYVQIYGICDTTPYDKLKLDLIHIHNYSIFLDLKPIFMTPKVLFIKEGTGGATDGQVTAVQQMEDLNGELKFQLRCGSPKKEGKK